MLIRSTVFFSLRGGPGDDEQLGQVELREALDGDAEGDEAEAGAQPREEGALGGEVVARDGAGVLVDGRAQAGEERGHPRRCRFVKGWPGREGPRLVQSAAVVAGGSGRIGVRHGWASDGGISGVSHRDFRSGQSRKRSA